jgi:polar amino acid transport system substrate-binding protein
MSRSRVILLGLAVLLSLTTPAPLQAADWPTIQARGYLKVGVKDNLRPLAFRDAQGNWQGLEIDLARRLAQELLGSEQALQLLPLPNSERLPALLADRVDVVIAQLGINTARARLVDFSPYYYLDGISIVTKKSSGLNSLTVNSLKLGVLQYSAAIAVLRYKFPQATLIPLGSYQEAYEGLNQGKIQAFAGDLSVLTGWVQEDGDFGQWPLLGSESALGVAFPRGLQYESLRQKVNWVIVNLRASGWLRQRGAHWGLFPFTP